IAMAGLEVELAIGGGEVVELLQINVGGAQAHLEILEILERVEQRGGFQRRMVEQHGLAFKARNAGAILALDVGEVVETGIDLRGADVYRRRGVEIAKAQGAVGDADLI